MSETAVTAEPTAVAASTPAPAPSGGFLGASPSTPEIVTTPEAPKSLFAGDFQKDGRFIEGWSSAFEKDYPSLAGKLSTAKDEKGALSILNNAVQIAGRRELRGAPDETWQPHEVAEYRKALGVPDEASGYKFAPVDPQHGQHWDVEAVKNVEALMHKHNIPAGFAKELSEMYGGILESQSTHAVGVLQEQIQGFSSESEKFLKEAYGADYENRREALREYAATIFTPDEQKTPTVQMMLSHPKIVAEFDKNLSALREGGLPGVGNTSGAGSKSPGQQMKELMAANPDWQSNPMKTEIAKQINSLANLQAQRDKRSR